MYTVYFLVYLRWLKYLFNQFVVFFLPVESHYAYDMNYPNKKIAERIYARALWCNIKLGTFFLIWICSVSNALKMKLSTKNQTLQRNWHKNPFNCTHSLFNRFYWKKRIWTKLYVLPIFTLSKSSDRFFSSWPIAVSLKA